MLMKLQSKADAGRWRCAAPAFVSPAPSAAHGASPPRSPRRGSRSSPRAGRYGGLRGPNAGCRASSGRVSPAKQGLRLRCCSLFPFAKVGVTGMSPLLRRGAEPCPLERGGDVSIKKTQKGEVSKNKTLRPLQALPVPEAGAKVLGAVCRVRELAGSPTSGAGRLPPSLPPAGAAQLSLPCCLRPQPR